MQLSACRDCKTAIFQRFQHITKVAGERDSTIIFTTRQRRQDLKLQFLHNFPKGSSVADPQASKNQRKLLSNSVAKTDNAIIPNAHINGVESLTVNKDDKVTVTLDDGGYNY